MSKLRIQWDSWIEIITSTEFEDGTHKGGHQSCVGCDGDMPSSFNFGYMSHWKYKTLEEKQNLVLTDPEGKKGGLYPFKNLKLEQLRGELWARGGDKSGTKHQLPEKLTELLGGTCRVPALLYGESQLSLEEINLNQYEVLFFEPLHCCLNHISHVLEVLPHHITGVDTHMTLKETLSIALKRQAPLHRLSSSTSAGNRSLNWKSRQQCDGFTDNTCSNDGNILHQRRLWLANLPFKHALAMRAILTPPKTMTICKLYSIDYHSAVHHASVIYRLVCLSSLTAELFGRFFDRIVYITRKTWSKHAENLVPNAFLHILGEDITAE